MSVEDISRLPVADLGDTSARLFLWATNAHLPQAFGVVASWGFTYRQLLTWDKRDSWVGSVAPNSEFVLVAVKGQPGRTGLLPSAVIRASQTKQHSRKPDIFLDYIEQISPPPYLELFARRQRLGWDTWGDECFKHVDIEALA